MGFAWARKLAVSFGVAADDRTPFEQDRDMLFDAARNNDTKTITEVAEKYRDEFTGWKTTKGSALNVAQQNDALDAFKLLVSLGCDINEDYNRGITPLLTAAKRGQGGFIDYMIDNGANLDAVGIIKYDSEGDPCSFAPLHLAVKKGDKNLAIRLLERGADPNVAARPRSLETTLLQYAENQKQFVIRDLVKRADKIRAEYLAAHPPAPTVPPATLPDDTTAIAVLPQLQLKKPAGQI